MYNTRNHSLINFIVLMMGLISRLYVSSPFGRVAMLDFLTYFLAPILFLIDWARYTKTIKYILLFALLWLMGGIMSDFYRDTPFKIALKANAIIFNAFTILVVALFVIRRTPSGIIWFAVGYSVSGIISLYYFQNGALLSQAELVGYYGQGNMQDFLADKMVYPTYVQAVLLAVILPLRMKKLIPWPVCILGCFACGIAMIVQAGARSTCLVYIITGMLMFLYVYLPRTWGMFFRNKMMTMIILVISAFIASTLYMSAAKSGLLGEAGIDKYESRKDGGSMLDNRADLLINWPFLWRNPIFGAGAQMWDRWGYVDQSKYVSHYINNIRIRHDRLAGHSCIIGAWTQCGLLGLFFWAYILVLMYRFIGHRLFALGDAGPFMIYIIISLAWHICFSPYGGFRGFVLFTAAFVALMGDSRYAEWAEYVFGAKNRRIEY